MTLIFEWDERKANANLKKHKVGFEEAKTVFADLLMLTYRDHGHSDEEARHINISRSAYGKTQVVVHTERGESIRIISCRKATANERNVYEEKRL